MKHILVDADSLVYAAACISETRTYAAYANGTFHGPYAKKAEALAVLSTDPTACVYNHLHVADYEAASFRLSNSIKRIEALCRERFGGIQTSIFISGSGNFRDRLPAAFPYKGNRVNVEKPQHLHKLRESLVRDYGASKVHHIEPDDEIAIHLSQDADNCVAVSIDKDIKQVAGVHLVPEQGFMTISPRSGLLRLYAQIIAGDPTDGVPGAYGYSVEGASKLLLPHVQAKDSLHQTAVKFWKVALDCYKASIAKRGLRWEGNADPEAAAIETARFVYLLRERPKDAANVKLWEPPV